MYGEDGVDFLSMRLVVVLIAAALLVSIAAVYANGRLDDISRDRARQEATRIVALAEAEYTTGPTGAGDAALSVDIPRCARRMVFGTESDARACFIEFADGTVETHMADCRFSPAVLYAGDHGLELEAVEANGTYFIEIREAA